MHKSFLSFLIAALILVLHSQALCGGAGRETMVIAHRGASDTAPENTLSAVKQAFELGADAAEVDVWLSKDGHPVVFHDPTTERTTGVRGEIKKLTLAEIRKLDAGKWMGKQFQGEGVPTLTQVLKARPADKALVIEIKDTDPAMVGAIAASLLRSKTEPDGAIIISFDYKTLGSFKDLLPEYPAYLLQRYNARPFARNSTFDELVRKCKVADLDGISFARTWPIDGELVNGFEAAGLKTFAWTVNSRGEAERLMEAGVAGITSDRVGMIIQVREGIMGKDVHQLTLQDRVDDFRYVLPKGMELKRNLLVWVLFTGITLSILRSPICCQKAGFLLGSSFLTALFAAYWFIGWWLAFTPVGIVLAYLACAALSLAGLYLMPRLKVKRHALLASGLPLLAGLLYVLLTLGSGIVLDAVLRA